MRHAPEDVIVSFAAHVGDPFADPREKARAQHWIDHLGRPTRDGESLVTALADQSGTRTAFRNLV